MSNKDSSLSKEQQKLLKQFKSKSPILIQANQQISLSLKISG
jgi:hypothetical protein